jgi:hypothetical protein
MFLIKRDMNSVLSWKISSRVKQHDENGLPDFTISVVFEDGISVVHGMKRISFDTVEGECGVSKL